MKNLKDWNEISKGFYKYVHAPGFCYEIIVKSWAVSSDILASYAQLCVTMTFSENGETYFEREGIFGGPLRECLFEAEKDFENNCKEETK